MLNDFVSKAGTVTADVAGISKPRPSRRALATRVIDFGTSSLVLSLFLPFTLLTGRKVQRFLIALLILDIPLRLEHHFAYQDGPAELGSIGGFGISVTTIALVALYTAWILESFAERGRHHPAFRFSLPLAAYVSIAALSLLVARDGLLGFFEVWILLQTLLVFVYFANRVRTRSEVLFVIRILLIGLALESAIIIAMQAGMRIDIPGHPLVVAEDAVGNYARIAGTIGSPINAAGYISLLMAPALSVLAAPVGRWDKRLAMLAFGLGFVALIFTFSRGAWIALVLSLMILGWAMRRRLSLKAFVLPALAMATMAFFLKDQIAIRLLGNDNGSAYVRVELMRVAFQMIRDHPVLGVGANNYPLEMTRYFKAGQWLYAVHDKYLLIWAEVGLGGLIAYVAFLIGTVRGGLRLWKSDDPLLSTLAIGLTAGIIGHMSHLFVDVFRGRVEAQLLWLMAGLIAALGGMNLGVRQGERQPQNLEGRPL
jgi:O-antigen ligase